MASRSAGAASDDREAERVIAVEQELRPGDPTAAAVGRGLVSQALGSTHPWGSLAAGVLDDVVLAASELVTNAIVVALERVCVSVDVTDGVARVAVYDDGPGVPLACARTADHPHGRGLSIVETVSVRWGVRSEPPGKWVWAEFPVAVPAA